MPDKRATSDSSLRPSDSSLRPLESSLRPLESSLRPLESSLRPSRIFWIPGSISAECRAESWLILDFLRRYFFLDAPGMNVLRSGPLALIYEVAAAALSLSRSCWAFATKLLSFCKKGIYFLHFGAEQRRKSCKTSNPLSHRPAAAELWAFS